MKKFLEDVMNTFFNFLLASATDTSTPTTTGGCIGGDPMTLIIYGVMIVAMILIFVFMNKKQKKQDQETKNMRDSIRIGDEVTTIGGIIGRVVSVKEDTVVIETSRDGTKIRFLKSAISKVDVTAEDAQAAKDKEAK